MNIIGLCGYKGAGKDTVANFLVKNHGYQRLSFADTLKDVVSIMFSWDRKLLEGTTVESRMFREKSDVYWSKSLGEDITPRKVLQRFGTETTRAFHKDLWVKILARKIELDKKYVISDVRFVNEIDFIKSYSGSVYWVLNELPDFHNELMEKIKMNNLQGIKVHRSEYDFLTGDHRHVIIRNKGTLEELEKEIERVIK